MRCLKVSVRCVRVGTFLLGVFIGGFYWGLGDFLLEWGVEFFT